MLTIIAFFMLAPVSLALESPAAIKASWDAAIAAGSSAAELSKMIGLSGIFYYL